MGMKRHYQYLLSAAFLSAGLAWITAWSSDSMAMGAGVDERPTSIEESLAAVQGPATILIYEEDQKPIFYYMEHEGEPPTRIDIIDEKIDLTAIKLGERAEYLTASGYEIDILRYGPAPEMVVVNNTNVKDAAYFDNGRLLVLTLKGSSIQSASREGADVAFLN